MIIQMQVNPKKSSAKGTNQLYVLHSMLSNVFSHPLVVCSTSIFLKKPTACQVVG